MILPYRNNRIKGLWIWTVLLFASCEKEAGLSMTYDHTVIVYIEANNNLKYEAYETLNRLEESLYRNGNEKNNIIAYIKDNPNNACLIKIKRDKHPYKIASDTLKVYSTAEYSSTRDMHRVLSDVKNICDSKLFSLVLWSHGTAWLPPAQDIAYNDRPRTKAFGDDRGYQMSIFDLTEAFPIPFRYIMFDACAMSNVEVLYEFIGKTDYIISSPTDVLSEGFPYHLIGEDLFADDVASLKQMADKYIQYYNSKDGKAQSATISVVKTSALQQLAETMNRIYGKQDPGMVISPENVQRLDFVEGFPVPIYDFGSYVFRHFDREDVASINRSLESVIVHKNRTELFFGNIIASFSGLSCYIPSAGRDYYVDYYKRYRWFSDSGIDRILSD